MLYLKPESNLLVYEFDSESEIDIFNNIIGRKKSKCRSVEINSDSEQINKSRKATIFLKDRMRKGSNF